MSPLRPVRLVQDREYNGKWYIDGKKVNPPTAYTDEDGWFDHLSGLHPKYKALVVHLRKTPKTSSLYCHMEAHVYVILLDHLDKNYAR
jgi:hypothetical protein